MWKYEISWILVWGYTKLYDSCVLPIMNYGSAVWEAGKYTEPEVIKNRVMTSFVGAQIYSSPSCQGGPGLEDLWHKVECRNAKIIKQKVRVEEARLIQ